MKKNIHEICWGKHRNYGDKDCDIIINHTNVSNKHCGIWILDNGEAKITNFSTDYPLKVNNQVITKPGKLNHGDVFTIVDRSFRFEHCKTATCYPDQKSKCKKHCPEITERTKISKEKVKAKSRKRRREKRQRYKETCAQNKLQQELANSITETEIVTEETPVPCKIRKQSNNFYEDLKKDPLFSNMVQYRRGHRLAANLLKKNSVLNLSLHSHN
ncbi:uncharacterized protein LOC143083518 [Mytilus galloprovincialis]|uniref:uncharacterized protein LOC143083518 n=1 Tax=Mytilus galloprovincialis TaxID=29158 RepID=UPI003F7B763F